MTPLERYQYLKKLGEEVANDFIKEGVRSNLIEYANGFNLILKDSYNSKYRYEQRNKQTKQSGEPNG